jgi:NADH:ubiquinone oxidoreductase subunit E
MILTEQNAMTSEIQELCKKFGTERSSLLPILQSIQRTHKFVSDFAQQEVARLLDIHPVEVYSVVSFYSFLNTESKGQNIIRLCRTIVCDISGKDKVEEAITKKLGIKFGETTKDKKISLEYTNCLGMCDQGPAMMVNEKHYTQLTPEKAVEILNNIKGDDEK